MEILIVRHGAAIDEAPGMGDAGRWLSAKGRKITRRVGAWLAKSKKRRPSAIWSSPLVRSLQTAEILAAEADFKGEVRALTELSPGRAPGDVLELLAQSPQTGVGPVMLVGHEPFLTTLITALGVHSGLAGALQKGAVLSLSWKDGVGHFNFLLDPTALKKMKHLAADGAPAEAGDASLSTDEQ